MIKSEDISVVVQGAIDKVNTPKCLKSIRKILPRAEIVLSTWEKSDVNGLDYDILVLNKDPGGVKHDFAVYNLNCSMNNLNRQILSTQNGIKKAHKKYVLKLRSDLILENKKFLNFWNLFPVRNKKYALFHHRLVCSTIYSREYSCQSGNGFPTPFHPSDFWFFGEKNDIIDYFAKCPLQTKEEAGNWMYKYPNRLPYKTCLWRYAPEQHFCFHWIKKYYPNVCFEDWSDWNEENIELSNNVLYNNFIFLNSSQSGIYSEKHSYADSIQNYIQGLITNEHFQQQYKKFCNPKYVIKKQEKKTEEKAVWEELLLRLKKHVHKFLKPFKSFLHWLSEPLSVLYYAFKVILKRGGKYESR